MLNESRSAVVAPDVDIGGIIFITLTGRCKIYYMYHNIVVMASPKKCAI